MILKSSQQGHQWISCAEASTPTSPPNLPPYPSLHPLHPPIKQTLIAGAWLDDKLCAVIACSGPAGAGALVCWWRLCVCSSLHRLSGIGGRRQTGSASGSNARHSVKSWRGRGLLSQIDCIFLYYCVCFDLAFILGLSFQCQWCVRELQSGFLMYTDKRVISASIHSVHKNSYELTWKFVSAECTVHSRFTSVIFWIFSIPYHWWLLTVSSEMEV